MLPLTFQISKITDKIDERKIRKEYEKQKDLYVQMKDQLNKAEKNLKKKLKYLEEDEKDYKKERERLEASKENLTSDTSDEARINDVVRKGIDEAIAILDRSRVKKIEIKNEIIVQLNQLAFQKKNLQIFKRFKNDANS